MKNILIIVSNANAIGPNNRRTGIFLPEVAHPYAEFDAADYRIDFASLTGETPYLDALNLADEPENLAFLTGRGWADMQKAPKLADVDASAYDGIFIPGGLAPMVDMPEHQLLKKSNTGSLRTPEYRWCSMSRSGFAAERKTERWYFPFGWQKRYFIYQRGRE